MQKCQACEKGEAKVTSIPPITQPGIDFFCVFSRFEYALKKANYLRASNRRAKPDWHKFIQASDDPQLFNQLRTNDHVRYLIDNPPWKQIVANGKLDWEDGEKPVDSLAKLIKAVVQVRNNLFHGGKSPTRPIQGTERDEMLLQGALVVFRALLGAHRNIDDAFTEE